MAETGKSPIVLQPGVTPMPMPEGVSGCPPGLEYLTQVDQLLIQQMIELIEIVTGIEMENKYIIKNTMGQQVYFAAEQSDCYKRQCCGPARPFSMSIMDNTQREVLHMERPLRCQGFCCPCSLQLMEVKGPDNSVLGFIKEKYTCLSPTWYVNDANDVTQLLITGPCWCGLCKCFNDVEFQILSADGTSPVGKIVSQWSGCVQECATSAGNFSVSFPMDMTVQLKALLLASVFLIDYMYYEHSNNSGGAGAH
ncbi:phospholipid scramblase 1-like [Oscarella lobularis]|uniref:phospholipid scramblase 1-like n=1 Tax=Oscarella lobularis TaxID=121494 RepID=UPI0033140E69